MFYTMLQCVVVSPFRKDDTHLKSMHKSARGRVVDVPMNQDLERLH